MTQNVWEQEAVKDLVQLEEGELNLCDFALFLSVMKNETAHRNVLSIIMGERNLELKEVHVEEVILNRSGQRAIRLDARATDISGRNFATEMQNDTEQDDMRRRARFYQGLMDTPVLKSGRETRYKYLPPTIITFITQKDIFGKVQGKAQSILELLEENGPVSEKTRNMILSETDMERLSVWLKAAARSGSEEDFLDRIQ